MKRMNLMLTFALVSFSAFAGTPRLFTDPVERDFKLPISLNSDMDGVCKYLGYTTAIEGSVSKVTHQRDCDQEYMCLGRNFQFVTREESVLIDSEGRLVKQQKSKIIKSIKCIK